MVLRPQFAQLITKALSGVVYLHCPHEHLLERMQHGGLPAVGTTERPDDV